MAITEYQMGEIWRKASQGEQLSAPNEAKNAEYQKAVDFYTKEVQRKAQNGESLQNPNQWKNQVYYDAQKSQQEAQYYSPLNIQQRSMEGQNAQMDAMARMLQQSANSSFQSQQALMQQALHQQITELQKAYENAVTEGNLSIREAEQQFNAQKQEIEKHAYVDAQATALAGEDRGIANSQQMLGLMQGDQARKNSMLNQNVSERDLRINNIKDRIKNLGTQKNLDMASANAQYGYGLAGARAQTDAQLQQQLAEMQMQNYQINRQQQGQLELAGLNQLYNQQNMAREQAYNVENMNTQQRMQLEQMAKAFGYDLNKMSVQQQYQLAQMAQSFGYDSAMQQAGFAHDSSMRKANFQNDLFMMYEQSRMRQEQELREYDLAVERELAKYDPNSREYQIRLGQLQDGRDALITELGTKYSVEAMVQDFAENGQLVEPKMPVREDFNHLLKTRKQEDQDYEKALEEYEQRMAAYQRYTNFQANPVSAFPYEQ